MTKSGRKKRESTLDLNRRLVRERGITWGCPDGLNIHDYPEHDDWDVERWRWEFSRRRYSIRNLYAFRARDDFAERTGKIIDPYKAMWLPEYRERTFGLPPSDAAFYGIGSLPNPLYSRRMDGPSSLDARTLKLWDLGRVDRLNVIGPRQIAIVFDPDKPLEPQLEGIHAHLASYRNHNTSPDSQRLHSTKLLEYLRILDAREAGYSWKRCAEDILPMMSAGTPQSARDKHNQAIRLQESL